MKWGTKLVLAAALFAGGMAVAVAEKPRGNEDETAIRALDGQWSAAAEAKDLEKTVSFYTEDAAAFPFNAPKAAGKTQVRELWAHLMGLPGFGLTFSPTEITVASSGDLAYDVGTFLLKVNDPQGNPAPVAGKYVVVWKKQSDKHWKVVADIFNTDK